MLNLKWITNKVLLYSTGNSAQRYVAAWMGGWGWERMDTCICVAESLYSPPGQGDDVHPSHPPHFWLVIKAGATGVDPFVFIFFLTFSFILEYSQLTML